MLPRKVELVLEQTCLPPGGEVYNALNIHTDWIPCYKRTYLYLLSVYTEINHKEQTI